MQKLCALSDVVLTGKGEMEALDLHPAQGQTFIVKNGKQGSCLLDEAEQVIYTQPPTEHVATDATGAGDTYAAAYVCAEMEGKSPRAAIRFATVADGISVTISGARAMPQREEIEEYLHRGEEK